ncbi:MAG: FAD-dependent oxidoreductase [Phycisphaerales bacterium]
MTGPASVPYGSGRSAIIVGAGLAGSLLAVYLSRAGWRVSVVERRSDPRAKGYTGGRSINLALSARGIAGLRGAGLDQIVLDLDACPMRGRMIHPPPARGAPVYQPYSASGTQAINSVSRGGLNLRLIEAAAASPNVAFHFDQACVDVDLEASAVVVQHTTTGEHTRHAADLVIGGDGAFSPVRLAMQKADRFEYSQSYLQHGYKELHIPPAAHLPPGAGGPGGADVARFGGYAMDPGALHIWPRGGSMMIALPNRDKSFTCTLFWPWDGPRGLNALRTESEVEAFFRAHYADAVPLMPTLARDYLANPSSSLVTVRCWPWQRGGKVVLLGDAAHAIVPFFGQGMNAAFEDCLELDRCLREHASDQPAALDHYQRRRKAHADAIADMALDNFVEMRDKVGTRAFRWKKKVEHALNAAAPAWFVPLYDMVSFTTIPYAEARERAKRQWSVVRFAAAALGVVALAAALLLGLWITGNLRP